MRNSLESGKAFFEIFVKKYGNPLLVCDKIIIVEN